MKTVRIGCFETNSSSSHSIHLGIDFVKDTIEPSNIIVLTGSEFGWGVESYDDALIKANYCAQAFYLNTRDIDSELLNTLKQVIKKETGYDVMYDEESLNSGYIDHQSTNVIFEEVGTDSDSIKNFIFNKNSILIIDNDNH